MAPIRILSDFAVPNSEQLRLLRNCLPLPGETLSAAELEWTVGRIVQPGAGLRWLLPLLAIRAEADGVEDRELLAKLRAARLYEAKRRQRFEDIAAEAIGCIASRMSPPIVSRGEVLAISAYPSPEGRHLHDLDLVVEDPAVAEATLLAAGYATIANHPGRLRHGSGMAVSLHSSPLPVEGSVLTRARLARDCLRGEIGGSPVLLPPRDSVLLHVLLLASAIPGTRATWLADGWLAVADGVDDWSEVAAIEGPDAFWLLRGLRILAHRLDAPVPPGVLDRLARTVQRFGAGDRLRIVERAARLRGRRALVRHVGRALLLPSLRRTLGPD